jgi:hypothetical protein
MKKKIFIAIIQVAITADNESEASDALTESLTNNLVYNGALQDWQYLKDGPQYKGEYNLEETEEGELFI